MAVINVYEYLDEMAIRRMILPKMKLVFEKNQSDLKIMANVLQCIEKIFDKLDKSQIIDEVLPLLWEVRLSDPEIILRVVRKYQIYVTIVLPSVPFTSTQTQEEEKIERKTVQGTHKKKLTNWKNAPEEKLTRDFHFCPGVSFISLSLLLLGIWDSKRKPENRTNDFS